MRYFYFAKINKVFNKKTIAKTDVVIIEITRNNPNPPASRDLGNLIPINADKIINVNNTAT